jgi:hypothetical protein
MQPWNSFILVHFAWAGGLLRLLLTVSLVQAVSEGASTEESLAAKAEAQQRMLQASQM